MQLTSNTTGMQAGLTVATDKDARDHCVVAVKGTFQTNARGEMTLAPEQRPLVTTDEHYGDPASTSVRYECDFALEKPLTDVLVVGKAVAPGGQRVKKLPVRLEVQGRNKDLMVYGERRWVRSLWGVVATDPLPFLDMPLTFDRAFGGQDDSLGPDRVAIEPRNLVGIGFHPHRSAAQIASTLVPNVELLGRSISSPRDRHEPAGFGCVGRAWQPRVAHAGTYDERWRDERAPFLPADFDSRYYQCAPADQQFPHFRGGERIRCVHMAEQGVVHYVIPALHIPVRFRFLDGDLDRTAVLDTITLEPHLGLAMLVWRTSVPLRKKLTALQEILVGEQPAKETISPVGYRDGKPVFAGLSATLAWLRQRREGKR
ncbi:DUF2169 domain-containing protein [Archangium sp.]|uniref:DUF2169 family type VI secretion system accessory protein n=1 Tax=Archangium sp. TaxID=1872627 RepID=UPI002D709F1E|nr:DUF2169 domain-containing protein [Archangium sp.]HYO52640.1 DUF2169 domain-containing protein [Archangium sp.]